MTKTEVMSDIEAAKAILKKGTGVRGGFVLKIGDDAYRSMSADMGFTSTSASDGWDGPAMGKALGVRIIRNSSGRMGI